MAIYKIMVNDDEEFGGMIEWASSRREAIALAKEMGASRPDDAIQELPTPKTKQEVIRFLRAYTSDLDNG